MIRIVINTGDQSRSQVFFEQARDIIKSNSINAELSIVNDTSVIIGNLNKCSSYYDIFIFDSANEGCLALSQKIRSFNFNASFIYVMHNNVKQLLKIIKYRPSQIISEEASKNELMSALKYCIDEQKRCKPYFTVKTRDTVMRINFESISHFESNQRKVTLHTDRQVISFYGKLGDIESLLPSDCFVRAHQSYLINLSKIAYLDKANRAFKLFNGSWIEISKSHYVLAVEKYEEYSVRS